MSGEPSRIAASGAETPRREGVRPTRRFGTGAMTARALAVAMAVAFISALAFTWANYFAVGDPGIYRAGRWHESPEKLTIVSLVPNGPLSEVREGDSIVAINDRPLSDALMFQWLSRRPGDRVQLALEYGSGRSDRMIHKQESFNLVLASRWDMPIYVITLLVYSVVGLMSVLVSAALGVLRPRERAARLMMLGEVCYAFALLLDVWGVMILYQNWLAQAFFCVFAVGTAALLHLSLTFPLKSPVLAWIERRGPDALRPYGGASFLIYTIPLAATAWLVRGPVIHTYEPVGLAILMLLAAAFALFRSYRRARTEVARAQLRWMIVGLGIGIVGMVLGPETGLPVVTPAHWPIAVTVGAWAVFPVAVAMAILRYRLFDIDVIIKRSLVYGVLTAMLAAVYFGGVVLLQPLFQGFTAYGSDLSVAVSTLVTALLFQPLRRRIQEIIDRRFYRRRYDAVQTLAAFGAAVRDEVDLGKLKQDLLWVVQETMEPAQASVWIAPTATAESASESASTRGPAV